MRSLEEALGPMQPYVIETFETAMARTADKLLEGLNHEQILHVPKAVIGLYLTGKAIKLNSVRGKSITTKEDVVKLAPQLIAPMSYMQLSSNEEERNAAVQGMIEAAIDYKCIGQVGELLMLTGNGLPALETIMLKEGTSS